MPESNVLDKAGLGSLSPLGEGGQGTVYETPRVRIDGNQQAVYKEYRPDTLGELNVDALRAMVTLLSSLSVSDGEKLMRVAAWPLRLVRDHQRITGFVMPRIPQRFLITMRLPGGAKQVRAEIQHLLNNETFLNTRGITISDQMRREILYDTAQALTVLHRHDIVVGDLSPKNLLFSLTERPRCYFIDCDAMRLRGRSVLPQAETPDWNVPFTGEERATRHTDAYKLGLLAVRLFAGDQSTRDPTNARLPRELRTLAHLSLSSQPMQRPKPTAWLRPLGKPVTPATSQPSLSITLAPPPPRAQPPASATTSGPRSFGMVAIGTLVFAALAVATTFLLQHGGPADRTDASGSVQTSAASAVHSVQLLLDDSRRGRSHVTTGVRMAVNCSNVAVGRREITIGLGNRQRLVARTKQLDLAALPHGAEIRKTLLTAFTESLSADRHYLNWANSVHGSCTAPAPTSPEVAAAARSLVAATAAKRQFLSLWRPVATTYHLPIPAEPDI